MIPIIFEDNNFLVINKPVGLSMHTESQQLGIVELVKQQTNYTSLWLVHRLDKVTSGLLILAKNLNAARTFGDIFSQRNIEKYYFAISDRKPKKKQGNVSGDMAKIRDGKWALRNTHENPARTQFFSQHIQQGCRLFIVKPSTGKTHQIRVMMKSLSSPILGDIHYGGTPASRTYLHAYALRFTFADDEFCITCLPEDDEILHAQNTQSWPSECLSPWQLPWPKNRQHR